jgi:hypothetical protein
MPLEARCVTPEQVRGRFAGIALEWRVYERLLAAERK